MRSRITLLAAVVLGAMLFVASAAQAYVFTFVRQPIPGKPMVGDPATICVCLEDDPAPGDQIVYDLYLDTEGESDIVHFGLGVYFDPTIVHYRSDLSDLADYVLYSPAIIDDSGRTPASWLVPSQDPPALWPGEKPPGLEQLHVRFVEIALESTIATATNAWLGRIVFQAIGPGAAEIIPGWDQGGAMFATHYGGAWDPGPPIEVVWAPEPTTALLVGVGLAALAAARRRR